jgi:hypothetical protein
MTLVVCGYDFGEYGLTLHVLQVPERWGRWWRGRLRQGRWRRRRGAHAAPQATLATRHLDHWLLRRWQQDLRILIQNNQTIREGKASACYF